MLKKIYNLCEYLEQIIIRDWWKYVDQIYKMINFDDYTNENIIEHNSKWPYIPDHPYRILIIVVLDQEKQMHS